MKQFVFQVILLLIVIAVGLYVTFNPGSLNGILGGSTPTQTSTTSKVKIKDTLINIEIADTQEKRAQGLSNRESLPSDSGMLFLFDKPDTLRFWMRKVTFPLDIIWIKDSTIVDITENALPPLPDTKDEELTIYSPKEPADTVLEVNGGFTRNNDIAIGDKVEVIQ